MFLSRHGRLAQTYWETYRPTALAALGPEQEQEAHFLELDARIQARIGDLTEEMLVKLPDHEQVWARRAVRAQAQEIVYDELVYLEKEPGTEHREM
ncbi:hypothetical protein [Streptomyces bohaiensis]|uniref:hypothetical protein n=1 Tax=Streptomyces bohaiensis TaxID=1431344 RepID=UPI003B804AA8